jgi:hypothetical protein
MGKYTSLVRTLRNELVEAKSREDKGSSQKNAYVNINNIDSSLPAEPSVTITTLRPTTLTTLIPDENGEKAPVICIHSVTQDECAVCSGYVRWLIEDDARISAARSNPEAARRRHREMLEGGL